MYQQENLTITCPRCGETEKCHALGETQKYGIEVDEDLTFIDNFGVGQLYYCHTCGFDFVVHGNIISSIPRLSYYQRLKEKFLGIIANQKEK